MEKTTDIDSAEISPNTPEDIIPRSPDYSPPRKNEEEFIPRSPDYSPPRKS